MRGPFNPSFRNSLAPLATPPGAPSRLKPFEKTVAPENKTPHLFSMIALETIQQMPLREKMFVMEARFLAISSG